MGQNSALAQAAIIWSPLYAQDEWSYYPGHGMDRQIPPLHPESPIHKKDTFFFLSISIKKIS